MVREKTKQRERGTGLERTEGYMATHVVCVCEHRRCASGPVENAHTEEEQDESERRVALRPPRSAGNALLRHACKHQRLCACTAATTATACPAGDPAVPLGLHTGMLWPAASGEWAPRVFIAVGLRQGGRPEGEGVDAAGKMVAKETEGEREREKRERRARFEARRRVPPLLRPAPAPSLSPLFDRRP